MDSISLNMNNHFLNEEKKHLLVNEKGAVGLAKHFSKSTETRDELSTTCNPNKSYVKIPVST